ncbi:MAG: penicillin-binding protein 2 [Candidatus Nomurabacteria bacterium]|nr:penicillin-binding protein 2 [Candidatus Nomurabacteria bacterium]
MTKSFQEKTTKIRLRIISGGFLLMAILIAARLFTVQVIHSDIYSARAERQYILPEGSIFERGNIFFTGRDGGLVSAATLKAGYRLALVPRNITDDPQVIYTRLAPFLNISQETFISRASKTNDPYEEIATHLPEDSAEYIKEMDIDGVQLIKEKWRFYPAESRAAQVIGFLGFDGDKQSGRYGLEREYNTVLSHDNNSPDVNFFAEIFTDLGKKINTDIEDRQGDIITTIEPQIQLFLDEQISNIQNKWSSKSVGGIIMDPKTGAIYAMGGSPSFNPNTFGAVDDIGVYTNPNVQSVFEMGSIMKPIIMSMGLESESITAKTEYFDRGEVSVDGSIIRNFDRMGRGQVTMQDVLNQSLNTGMVLVAERTGNKTMRNYFEKFGFTEKTDIDLPGEPNNLTSNLKSNRAIEFANMAFGQGIAVTPISMIRALSALGNGGTLPTPHVVRAIKPTNGILRDITPESNTQRAITVETSEEITRMLVTVLDSQKDGELSMPNHSIAAKTGTAQIANPAGGYYTDRNLHSFFGYLPAYDPQFIVLLWTEYPKEVKFASQTLMPPFLETAEFLINYYDVPPDR